LQAKVIYIIIIFVNLLLYIYSTANIKAVKNKNIFPNDFFEVYSQQNSQKDHPKLLNPRNTVRIIPSNINEIKAIIEETEEENVEHTQQKKNNDKCFISENSNDEPSTSGSKISQNTPFNSPLIYREKSNNENKKIPLNKLDNKIIQNEESLKVTPHFINENTTSCEIIKGNRTLRKNNNQNIEKYKKIKVPLTCENRCFTNYKFNFKLENKGSGVILSKDKEKPEEKKKVTKNVFRIGKKFKDISIKRYDYSINAKYQRKGSPKEILSQPMSSSLITLKCKTNQTSPENYIKKNEKIITRKIKLINNIRNKQNSNDTQKKNRQSRPKSMLCNSPHEKNISKNEKSEKNKKNEKNKRIILNRQIKYRKRSCKSMKSIHSMTILPNLPDNKLIGVKNKLETEFKSLVKILPDNYEEFPEIKSNLDLIFKNIYGLKDYINQKTQTQYAFMTNNK
jgi:hypothetical protein